MSNKIVQEAYIVEAVRTPVGKAPRGKLKHTRPDDMLAHVLKALLNKTPDIDQQQIADVIVGCAMPEAEQGMNVARIGLLLAGLPNSIPGMTINRFCSSGLQALALAANQIRLGEADLIIAGGTETMSMVPMMGHKVAVNPSIFDNENIAIAYGMGITAENVAKQWDISREKQDEFAYHSHQKAIKAISDGDFSNEIVPYPIDYNYPDLEKGEYQAQSFVMKNDEGPRADTSLEILAKLRPVFKNKGSVTAGNSSQMSDGAGAILLASEQALKTYNLKPIAKFSSYAVAGVPPEIMGIGPIKAIPKALELANLNQQDIDWIELNEAFAAQSLAVIKDLKLNPEIVNPLGGAIALGHPLGATGAIRTATAVHALKRKQLKHAMITMCIGTGMGAAGIITGIT